MFLLRQQVPRLQELRNPPVKTKQAGISVRISGDIRIKGRGRWSAMLREIIGMGRREVEVPRLSRESFEYP